MPGNLALTGCAAAAILTSRGNTPVSASLSTPGKGGGGVPPPTTMAEDWVYRSTATGSYRVTQAKRFTSQSDVDAGKYGVNYPNVVWDPTDGLLGDGCLRIDHPGSVGQNPGAYWIPLDTSWTTDGQGMGSTTYYCQWRYKPGANRFLSTTGGGGAKIAIFGGFKFSDPGNSSSHIVGEIVVGHYGYTRVPSAYRDSSNVDGQTANGFVEPFGGSDAKLLNGIDNGGSPDTARYCLYNGGIPSSGCWLFADEWTTIDVRMTLPSRGGAAGNRFQMWVTREFESTRRLVLDFTDFSLGSDSEAPNGIAGFWATNYDTGRTSASFDTWDKYDQIVFSKDPIPVPLARSLPSFVPATQFAWAEIPASNLSATSPSPNPGGTISNRVDAWNGFALDIATSTMWQAATGGHNDYAGNESNRNQLEISGQWEQRRAPTASVQDSDYYADGSPASRHTYYGEMFDHWSKRVLVISGARWQGGQFSSKFDAFNVVSSNYVAAGTFPDLPSQVSNSGSYSAVVFCMDLRNGTIYTMGNFNLYKSARPYTSWANSAPTSFAGGETVMRAFQRAASAFDTKRNRILVVGGDGNPGRHHYAPDTGVLTQITFSGSAAAAVSAAVDAGLVYVYSQDAYYLCLADAGATVYRIDASTFECTTVATTGGSSIPASLHGPFTRWAYVPRLKGVVHWPTHGGNGWLLRIEP